MEDPENLGSGMAGADDSLVKQYPSANHQFLEVPSIMFSQEHIFSIQPCRDGRFEFRAVDYDDAGCSSGDQSRLNLVVRAIAIRSSIMGA